jgi:hypothetical protein
MTPVMVARRTGRTLGAPASLLLGLLALLGLGCATVAEPSVSAPGYAYFVDPDPQDAWSPKIAGWQWRARAEQASADARSPAAVSGAAPGASAAPPPTDLRAKYEDFVRESRRALAREAAEWIQKQSRLHYIPDGPIDHWATLDETLDRNGDDCDGLELLVFHFLRDAGFGEDEVLRAIVYRPKDGLHHMVTLWFESPDDPWVIDPTGAMTSGMPRMSEVPGWVPLKVFDEHREYTVLPAATATAAR